MSRFQLSGLRHSRLKLRKLARLRDGHVQWIRSEGLDPPDVLAPSEYAPVWPVDLPLEQSRQRLSALPYALEERLSQPIEELHFGLSAASGEGGYAGCAVERVRMDAWRSELAASGVTAGRLIPEANFLPEPVGDALWSVAVEDERALVRTRAGAAFSVPLTLWPMVWLEAGRPPVQRCGDAWDSMLPEPATESSRYVEDPASPAINLLQGDYRPRAARGLQTARAAAMIVAIAASGHLVMLGVDAAVLLAHAAEVRTTGDELAARLAPERASQMSSADALTELLISGSDAGALMPLLSDVSEAVTQASPDGAVSIHSLSYSGADETLEVQLDAADLSQLDRAAEALKGAGLTAESGGARRTQSGAEQTLTVRRPQGEP